MIAHIFLHLLSKSLGSPSSDKAWFGVALGVPQIATI